VDRPGEDRSVVVDPTPTPTPVPEELPRRLELTSDVPSSSATPGVPYRGADAIHLPDGSTVAVRGAYDTLLPLGDGYLVGGYSSEAGDRSVTFLDPAGDVVWSEPSLGSPVVSPSGRLAAYTRTDGRTVSVEEGGDRSELMTSPEETGEYQVAAVSEDSGSCRDTGASCTVYSNSTLSLVALTQTTTNTPRSGAPTHREKIGDLPLHVEAASLTGDLAVMVSADAAGACSAVTRPGGARRWRTCDWQLGGFSPDGRFVLGYPLGDGGGPRGVAVLDVRNGDVVREFLPRGAADVFVHQAVWETTGSVLATVWDVDHWSVLRLGLDGSRAAVPVVGTDGAHDPGTAPVALAPHP